MQKLLFIINPIAGSGQNNIIPLAGPLLPYFIQEYAFTRYPGHASELARQAIGKGYAAIISVGGDGTFNEIARELVNTGEKLAIIPLGSGNALARHLGIPVAPDKALPYLNNARSVASDVGRLNNLYFFSTCGFGFDAHIADLFSRTTRRGAGSYFRNICREIFCYRSRDFSFRLDHVKMKHPAFILVLANTSQYGNRAIIAPGATIDSGKLICCIVAPLIWYQLAAFAYRLLRGRLNKAKNYKQFYCSTFEMMNYTGLCHIDGEPLQFKGSTIKIEIIPAALRILIPQ